MLLILGNGHSLGMGCRSGYKDFAKTYLETNAIDYGASKMYKFLMEKNKSRINQWSDLEQDLKDFALDCSNASINFQVEKYFFDRLRKNLGLYMSGELCFQLFCNGRESCSRLLNSLPARIFDLMLQSQKCYDVVSFNYMCLEELIATLMARKEGGDDYSVGDLYKYRSAVNNQFNINYIHISGDQCVLGIEDDDSVLEQFSFLKKKNQVDEEAIYPNEFNQYDTIVIYGHSFGTSDTDFFKKLFSWLSSTKKKISFLIVTYDDASRELIKENIKNMCAYLGQDVLDGFIYLTVSTSCEERDCYNRLISTC